MLSSLCTSSDIWIFSCIKTKWSYCVKSACIRSYSAPHSDWIRRDTESLYLDHTTSIERLYINTSSLFLVAFKISGQVFKVLKQPQYYCTTSFINRRDSVLHMFKYYYQFFTKLWMVKTSSNDRDKNKPLIRFSWWAVSYLQIIIETIPANISYSKTTIEKLVKSVK